MEKQQTISVENIEKIETLEHEISQLKQQIFLQKEILDKSPHFHVLVKTDGEILEFNNSVKNLVNKFHNGTSPPKNISNLNFIPPSELNKFFTAFKSILSGEKIEPFESFFQNSNENIIPIKIHMFPVNSLHNNTISIYATDITHLKETKKSLKESEKYYKTIFEHNATATVIVDENNIISLANSQTEQIFGYKPIDIMGKKKWTDFVLPEHQLQMIKYQKLRYSNSTTAPNQYEFQIFDRRGNKKDIFANVCLIPGTKRTLASILDITERNESLKKIEESEGRYRTLAEAVEEFVFIFNREDRLEYINEFAANKLDIVPSQVVGKSRSELIAEKNYKLQTRYLDKVFESGESIRIEDHIFHDQTLWLDTIHIPLKNNQGFVEKVLIVSRDITERKNYEMLINGQNEILKCMGTILTKAIISETEDDLTKTALDVCEDITQSEFGFICEINLGEDFDTLAISESALPPNMVDKLDINPMLTELKIHETCESLKTRKKPIICNELNNLPLKSIPNHHPTLQNLMVVPLLKEGDVIGFIGLANKKSDYDSSDANAIETISSTIVETIMRKRAEQRLQNALKDKEMLVKEIHHRTKNNLMIMASLLNLTSAEIEDEDVKEIFNQTQTRAKSMALIHEKLYRSDNYKEINFGEYIRHMVHDLFKSFLKDPENIQLILELEDLELDINTAIPLGLILNELLTNSLKYAFPHGEKGNIFIKFYKSDNNYVLIVADDGIGLPEELDINQTDTLGLQLVKNLIGQIEGDIIINIEEGTMMTIIFPENNVIS